MKRSLLLALLLSASVLSVFAQSPIRLYEGKAPGSENWTHQEATFEYYSPYWDEINTVVLNVVDPVIIPYLPAPGTETGAAMIVCPGGGYYALSYNNEGPQVAQWLADHGIAAFVLKYRLSYSGENYEELKSVAEHSYGGKPSDPEYQALVAKNRKVNQQLGDVKPLANNDGRRAVEYVREHAAEFGVDPHRIGMVGFSAGGALCFDVLFNHTEASKPDLVGIIYGAAPEASLPSDPAPLFIAATQYEIGSRMTHADEYYKIWCDNKLPAEIHSFTDSRHGFGYRPNGAPENLWITLFYNFMKKVHFLGE